MPAIKPVTKPTSKPAPPPAFDAIYRFRPLAPRLFSSGQPTEAQLASAAQAGVQVVINLALHDDPRYSLPDEPASVQALGMDYVHIPVPFDAPTRQHLQAFFAAMQQHAGRTVLVHCAANLRVSGFMGLYRALCLGVPQAQAFAVLQELWPEPDAVWTAFIAETLAQPGLLQAATTQPTP
jgi:uncharacterized protein (TIGR01244 family)